MTPRTDTPRAKSLKASRRPGFTLIELILVMTILTTVIGVAAPSLARFFRGRTLDSEAKRLLALTRHGQNRAVSEGVPIELWLDATQRTFGLETATSYDHLDAQTLNFTLDTDIQIEVINIDPESATYTANSPNRSRTANSRSSGNLLNRASQPPVLSKHPSLPTIRFLPDGSIDDSSPQLLHLTDRDSASLWLALARNRVSYEIRTQNR